MANKVRFLICFLVFPLIVGASIFFQHGKGLLSAPLPQQRGASAPSVARQSLLSKFANPPSEYGPIDCWWWEGAHLSREKLTWQLEQLKDKGVAGTWFYPRFPHGDPLSSDPRYWTNEWWNLTHFALEEHRRLGLKSWFSDWTAHQYHQSRLREERRKSPELTGRRLVLHQKETKAQGSIELDIPREEEVLHAAAYRKVGTGLDYASRVSISKELSVDRKLRWQAPEADWLVTAVTSQPSDLNYLDKAVVNRWVELFLEVYQQRVPGFVGNTLAAYGPDEMWLLMGNILYSPTIIDKVRTEKGYDLSAYLPALFHDIGAKTDQVRCDYYGAMVSLLEENCFKVFSQWLEKRGMQYVTIATWGREDPLGQTFHYGDFFRYMRWFHVTGNEDPNRSEVGERKFIDAKLSSSIAHLNQRQRAAMCVYWGSGWGMTLEENLAWTHENFAYGLNLYNQHGGQYTLMGGWYEWVPPSVHFYQPYWQFWRVFTDYIRRLSFIMSQGNHRADVALLYPTSTMHANWLAGPSSGPLHGEQVWMNFTSSAKRSAETTLDLAKRLYRSGTDLDFLDEGFLAQAEVAGQTLQVSNLEFRAMVLPPLTTIRRSALEKIAEFFDKGGTVVAFGSLPNASAEQGRHDPQVQRLIKHVFGEFPEPGNRVVISRSSPSGGKAFFVPENAERVGELIRRAIVPDVDTDGDLFHTHQKVGELDVYYLFNPRSERRNLNVRVRVKGEPEIWDAHTGKAHALYDFQRDGQVTRVALEMEPHQAIVLVMNPVGDGPEVAGQNLSILTNVVVKAGQALVEGFDHVGGKKRVRVVHRGQEYVAEGDVAAPPSGLSLKGPFSFRLEPTMDNRWGDFRHPAAPVKIGAEARRFRYREESQRPGTELSWQSAGFHDVDWPEVTYSYGPYWWQFGPLEEAEAPGELVQEAKRGEIDPGKHYRIGRTSLEWQPYTFSQKFGSQVHEVHSDFRQGSLLGVSENFLAFDAADTIRTAVRYLATTVVAPRDGDYIFCFGGKPEKADYDKSRHGIVFQVPSQRQAWINGEEVLNVREKKTDEVQTRVRLKQGNNPVLLRIVHPGAEKVATYATFQESVVRPADPYVPLLRWFTTPERLVYDISPQKQIRVGWYRFKAPPGLQALRFTARMRHIQAWIDGVPAVVNGNQITLKSPKDQVSQVALRIEQEAGSYAGAAFLEPIVFECKEGKISVGDWSHYGLESYSGAAVYSHRFRLAASQVRGKVFLSLGDARTLAALHVNGKPAGTKMSRPFRFDITHLVKAGDNEVHIKIANTLANHMSTYPTKFVYEGQTVSGLLGPVELQFLSPVTLTSSPRSR